MKLRTAALAAIAAVTLTLGPALTADAATSAHHYSSCAAVHRVYSGGIAKTHTTKNTIRHRNGTVTKVALKGKVHHSTASYNANRSLDRDHDGVACEKS